MAEQKVRFAFTITDDGPSQGLTSGPWRVKVTKNDVYIYAKELGDKWKTSLHGDSAWRTAVTSETHRSDSPILPPDEDRAPWKYTPTEFKNGVRLAFVLACTRGCLRPNQVDRRDIQVRVNDRWDQIAVVYITMTEPDVDQHHIPGLLAEPMNLSNGRLVWLHAGVEFVPNTPPEPVPISILVASLSPDHGHDVSAPGLILRGIHLPSSD